MIYREKYLSEIRGFYHSDLIKIITGVRHCGKSFVLEQIMPLIPLVSSSVGFTGRRKNLRALKAKRS